jgi:hypothetical protein
MTESESQLYQIKGMISDLPEGLRKETEKVAAQIRALALNPAGQLAIALIGCEMQATAEAHRKETQAIVEYRDSDSAPHHLWPDNEWNKPEPE